MNKRGFSLIEFLIYIAIFSVIAGLMTGILAMVLKVNQKESASAEATSQLNFVMQTIGRLVRESSNIEIATSIATPTLKLRMKDSAGIVSTDRDPIVIWLDESSKIIKMSEGTGDNKRTGELTNNRVIADKLEFKKFSQYPGHDTVSIDIQLTYNSNNPNSRITRSLQSAIARVSAATFDSDVVPGSSYDFSLGQNGSPWKRIYMADGLPDSPSYTFSANPGLGMFASSSSALGFSTAGSQKMIIVANGNVGIGTTAPATQLHLNVPGDSQPDTKGLWLTDGGQGASPTYGFKLWHNNLGNTNTYFDSLWNNDASAINFRTKVAGSPTTAMTILGSGNVGIGTINPQSKLVIAGDNIDTDRILIGNANPLNLGELRPDFLNSRLIESPSGLSLRSARTGSPHMFISPSGNVGIGTMSPETTLHVQGQIKATGGTPIYQCPNGDPDWQRNQCVNQLSTASACLFAGTGGEYTASCTLVGRMVAPVGQMVAP